MAAAADSTSERRFSALFEYVLHHPQGNERTGDIRSSWVDVTTAAGPLSPQTRSCNKNGGVLELFLKFRRGTENRGFIRIKKKLSQKYFKQIDSF